MEKEYSLCTLSDLWHFPLKPYIPTGRYLNYVGKLYARAHFKNRRTPRVLIDSHRTDLRSLAGVGQPAFVFVWIVFVFRRFQ